ncbi:MAG: 2-vinyl bacteriochlorophyllide hydratase [Pseudomonadota bacterium]
MQRSLPTTPAQPALYTAEQRTRRDASPWTMVQAILAPLQFLVFLVSVVLVIRYLVGGEGFALATASVVIKTLVLYTIMVTGALWERDVFGQYLFAGPFFWEDVVSMLVIGTHTAYLIAVFTGALGPVGQMLLALIAYATYVVNAVQFVLKLRQARMAPVAPAPPTGSLAYGAGK